MDNIDLYIDNIRNRLSRATVGPWKYITSGGKLPCSNHIENFEHKFICKGGPDNAPWTMSDEDAEFITNARTDIEILLELYDKTQS